MKKYFVMLVMLLPWATVHSQDQEIAQLILNVEKLSQFKQILSDMKTGYTVVMQGYTAIRDISQGNFDLHKAFLDGLLAVSPMVRNYKKAADILTGQLRIAQEYKAAYNRFRQSGAFNPDELLYLGRVYNNLLDRSLKDLDDLATILTAGKLRMSDEERLAAIDRLYADTSDKLQFLRSFNNQTTVLALQRIREKQETSELQQMYGP